MLPTLLLAVSTALQFGAAVLALRLVRVTGRRFGWGLVAAAVFLMGVRRAITLYRVVGQGRPEALDLPVEIVALAISVLIFFGILGVGRLFQAYESSERRLRTSQERYRQAVENSPNPIFSVDRSGTVTSWNGAAARIFEFPEEEAVGMAMADLLWEEEAGGRVAGWLERVFRGETLESLDLTYRCRDGSERVTLSRLFPVTGPGGAVEECMVANTDLTERRQLQERLLHSQKMEAIGRLAGGVAHDFNNVLTAILGSARLLEEEMEGNGSAREYAEEIRIGAERAARLVASLMTFSRRRTPGREDVELNRVISEMDVFLRRLLKESIRVETRLDPELPPVRIDPGHVEQILANLAVNASDAMPAGGTLTVSTTTAPTTAEAEAPGPWVVLEVADTGTGMDAATRARIFEPFFTTKDVDEGTGLGLSTIYGIVQQNRGRLEVESAPGDGSTFRVYLPVAGAEARAGEAREGEETEDGDGVFLNPYE